MRSAGLRYPLVDQGVAGMVEHLDPGVDEQDGRPDHHQSERQPRPEVGTGGQA